MTAPARASADGSSASSESSASGSVTTKRAPPPSASRSSTRPPWASATARTIASPRPLPPPAAVSPAPRAKRSKIRSRSSGGTPGPRSETSSTASPSRRRADTVTGVPGGGVHERVLDQVGHQAVKVVRHADHRHGLGRVERERLAGGQRARLRGRLARHRREVERPLGRLAPGVGAREQQQVGHEAAHPLRGAQRRAGHLAGLALELGLEQLEVGQDARERRAQLVRGVGHEVALALERRLALAARGAQLAEHVLEGVGQVRDLVVGPRLGQPHVRVARAGHLARRAGEPGDRAHGAPGHEQPAREGQEGAADHAEGEEQRAPCSTVRATVLSGFPYWT